MAQIIAVSPTDTESLIKAAQSKGVDFTIVGPEAPLAAGIVDEFQAKGLPIFGPTRAAAEIESSKVFAKELMQKYNIPCARSASFSSYNEAREYLKQQEMPIVVKADGLAAGKGVTVASSMEQALEALANIMEAKAFGSAGDRVLIEECLEGREMSVFVFTDGHSVIPTVPACDYKPVFDGDRGPNTGGMGSYSPPHFITPELAKAVAETIMQPTVKALASEGRPYTGVLYGGLMITDEGPKVMEFNARLGDPETQVVLPRLKTDLVDIILGVINGNLDTMNIEWSDDACVGVVLASGGYPGSYKKGLPITGWGNIDEDITIFHAGTELDAEERVTTSGGRVLTVVATGETIAKAREKVYNNISRLHFEDCHYRKDIALIK
jgi:phosphoribosylamine--glycine ligase